MKNIIITCCLYLLSLTSAHAQWQKVAGRNTIKHQTLSFENYKSSFTKYKSIVTSNGTDGLYYSKDDGKNWKILRPSYFKPTDTILAQQNIVNDLGIFIVYEKNYNTNSDSTFIFFTPDFGITWEKKDVPLLRIRSNSSPLMIQNKNYIYYLCSGQDAPYSSSRRLVLRYKKIEKKWEDVTTNYPQDYGLLALTDSVEYVGNSYSVEMRYANGTKVVKTIPNQLAFGFTFIADSLMYRSYYYNEQYLSLFFSKDFGTTWYEPNSSLPLPRYNLYYFTYKSKLYVVADSKIYSSIDKGLNWALESSEIEKYAGRKANPKLNFQDTVLCFNFGNLVYGYNIETKKIACYNQESLQGGVYSDDMSNRSKIVKLPNGKLLLNSALGTQYINFISSDKGLSWQPNIEYPFHFDKITVNDSTYYLRDPIKQNEPFVIPPMIRYVNNIRKDTISAFPSFNSLARKGDTIIVSNPTGTNINEEYAYSTQPPFNTWTAIPNTANINPGQILSFNNKELLAYIDNYWQFDELKTVKLDGTVKNIPRPNNFAFVGYRYLDATKINNIWSASYGSLFNSNDTGRTWRRMIIPAPTAYSSPYRLDRSSLLVVNKPNTPTAQILILTEPQIPHISVDSGKTWLLFNTGIENDIVYKTEQVDSFLFAFTNYGLYRRSLNDVNLRSVSGFVYNDINGNNRKDTNEPPIVAAKISSKKSGAFVLSDSAGFYTLIADATDSDTISASYDNKYATITPTFHITTKSDTGKHFAIKLSPNVQDLKIDITALTPPRPGFNNEYQLNYKNVGSTIVSGTVTFNYNAKQSFLNASNTLSSNVNQVLTWAYTNLQPNESRAIKVFFKTAVDVPVRSLITNIANITPLSIDTFKADNVDTLIQTVVGSYDPNDKQVSFLNSRTAPSVIAPSTELIYTIRFQNTGNYPADFVKVVDTLSDKLDLSTFRLIATSHKGTVAIRGKNVLAFDFNPIYLPDSSRDEAGSHGFVKFAIKPKRALTNSEDIQNTGFIYFDYNPAIVTNTIKTANVKGASIFTPSVSAGKLIISPNPAQQTIRIEVQNLEFKEGFMSIYDLSGRLILSKSINKRDEMLNIEGFRSGEYICTITSKDNKVFVEKFVKVD